MTWLLFPSSGNHVSLEPARGPEIVTKQFESPHRARSGKRYNYKWGSYSRINFDVQYVNSSTAALISSWWFTDTKLILQESGKTAVYSVQLTSNEEPVRQLKKPHRDKFHGKIDLETY